MGFQNLPENVLWRYISINCFTTTTSVSTLPKIVQSKTINCAYTKKQHRHVASTIELGRQQQRNKHSPQRSAQDCFLYILIFNCNTPSTIPKTDLEKFPTTVS